MDPLVQCFLVRTSLYVAQKCLELLILLFQPSKGYVSHPKPPYMTCPSTFVVYKIVCYKSYRDNHIANLRTRKESVTCSCFSNLLIREAIHECVIGE